MKKILGFVGSIASGKGTACKYLQEKHGADSVRYSTMLRDMVGRLYLPETRDVLIKMSETVRGTFGDDIMAKVVKQEAESSDAEIVCIDGIRRPKDIEIFREVEGFVLVHIKADIEKRFERLVGRDENQDDTSKTFEQFKKEHERSTEKTIASVAEEADVVIDNNGSFEDLYKELDRLV